jgi:itaconyl-CoA hydratase
VDLEVLRSIRRGGTILVSSRLSWLGAGKVGAKDVVQSWKEVGPGRYRETFGRHFEDFAVGDVYEHRPGKTVTEADNHLFTLLTLNTHPLHFDAEYGAATEFGRNLVVSTYTLALLIGMSVSDVSQKAIANLGMDEVKFPAPVFAGDTLYAESEVISKRESASRPGQGIVEIRTSGKNQRGEIVCVFRRTMLIPKRGHAVEDRIGTY